MAAGCSATAPDETVPEGYNVLFLGNSLTYTNNLPLMVENLAPTVGGEPLHVGMIAFPNVALEDLWNTGEARTALASGDWDMVVMQQGPSSLPESQAHLATWVDRFSEEARTNGVEPAVLMVWPPEGSDATFQAVIASYANAANAASATLFPAGSAWFDLRSRNSPIDPYGPDRFHPSVEGTYLAALIVAAQLRGRSAVGLPSAFALSSGETLVIDESAALSLQQRADAAIAAYAD
ncbi:MAG: hypothetical protein Rubg2KO_37150 [Rubricoccaceae bacterium]